MKSLASAFEAVAMRSRSTGCLMLISLAVIAINFLVSVFSPTTHILEDEIAFYDTVWRNVLGYRLGIDYHNPLGFGPFQFAALLWDVLGPSEYLLKLANTLLVVPVALLACVIVTRYKSLPAPFALVFCVATAMELSSPNSFGFGIVPTSLGLSGFYNRISIACLSVLFLHAFAAVNGGGRDCRGVDFGTAAISAVLIYVLFLFKISAFFIGLMILGAGVVACRGRLRGIGNALTATVLALIMIGITAFAFRIGFAQMIGEYVTAGEAKGIPGVVKIYGTLLKDPFLLLNAIAVIFGVHVLRQTGFRGALVVVTAFVVCGAATFLLNLSNEYETVWMFPPAIAIMAAAGLRKAREKADPDADAVGEEVSDSRAIAALPVLAFLIVLAGQAVGTFTAILSELAIVAGVRSEYVVSGGKDIRFRTFCSGGGCAYEESISDGLGLIKDLRLTHEVIATLTHSNPFPVLLGSQPHKGTEVWWNFGFNVPEDAELQWQDVLGDATVVMVPLTGDYPDVRAKLLKTVKGRLARDFELLRTTDDWKVYRLKGKSPS